ncbi:TerC family protein [Quadrisphaera sp. DSM 44207]|uniref:TerC family protein n=1 Tax=Quadrisphaera sp. DSM 44207 TaxID=1881057 RepID=UPI00088261CF|nr:TerC family protein [Quadrisphaera sp. DSM 44207]SDQ44846.1 tellurite resistance protein TerC [Quadrisphaera sp. DSM 44207]
MAGTSALAWGTTIGLVVALLVLDFVIAARRPHSVEIREATAWSVFYIGVALLFGVVLLFTAGAQAGGEYFAGWVVEKSLSVDNLFIFVIIMTRFAVPDVLQQRVLLFGIAAALVMRAVFIALGAAVLSAFSWAFVVFGLFLIYTAVQLARHRDEDPDGDNAILRAAQRRLPLTAEYHGTKLFTRENGKRMVTPLFIVFLAIASTDLLFALDSIPAVFGITQDPFLVFAANAFALLGLRALYFLIHGLLEKLVYLSLGLSVILGFIGVKLILHWLHVDVSASVPEIPTWLSLVFIIGVLVITTVASLRRVRAHPQERAHAGRIHGRPHQDHESAGRSLSR